MKRVWLGWAVWALSVGVVWGQEWEEDEDDFVGVEVVERAVARAGLARLEHVAVALVSEGESEARGRTLLRVEDGAVRFAGVGFAVVLGPEGAFWARPGEGGVEVEELEEGAAQALAYERDLRFLPVVLGRWLEVGVEFEAVGRTWAGDPVVRVEAPGGYVLRLRFDRRDGWLRAAMGVVPFGEDAGAKRWLEYEEWSEGEAGWLPRWYVDRVGEDATPRGSEARWETSPEASAEGFLRP